jgi:mRNA interferase RelE/StbE
MQIKVEKRFYKDLLSIDNSVAADVLNILELAETVSTLYELPNLKKLQGFKNAYRIRIGKYRIGLLTIENDTISFERCLPRGKIYKVFP